MLRQLQRIEVRHDEPGGTNVCRARRGADPLRRRLRCFRCDVSALADLSTSPMPSPFRPSFIKGIYKFVKTNLRLHTMLGYTLGYLFLILQIVHC